ncbi:hypothetical protein KIN20_008929 [Parelaphostrongylus tenuis]|uniref:Uncharacterized protein n=1 Tax=Parelaphostrongylus tenuis TaxID=148309 RepID=A0AAD5M7G8_PARTN|nr:hypothetical protein KIN20_008929 [Parelaphostrongylus tenuis]
MVVTGSTRNSNSTSKSIHDKGYANHYLGWDGADSPGLAVSRRGYQSEALLCSREPLQLGPITSTSPQSNPVSRQRRAACRQIDTEEVNQKGLGVSGYFE